MAQKQILDGAPLDEATLAEIVERFHKDGYALVPGVLDRSEVDALRTASDAIMDDADRKKQHYHPTGFVGSLLFEGERCFRDVLVREPIIGLVEAILGRDCQCCGQNVIRNAPGTAISNWHVDDLLEFPLPESIPRHDARMRMPVLWLTVQVALTDIDGLEFGPTQCVPGSHYAGHPPNDRENPTFDGAGPVALCCKAGDIYLQNHQCWHRGAPNVSQRTRYVMQLQYCRRWAARRFMPPCSSTTPEWVLEGADDRLNRVLGQSTTRA